MICKGELLESKTNFIIIIVLLFTFCIHTSDLANMSNITAYTQRMPELVENENNNPYAPLFTAFNRSHAIWYVDKLLRLFGLRKFLDIDDFITTIRQVTKQRELNGYFGSFIEKYYISTATRWFVWGAFYGAVHAQVNALQYLKEQRIINDELQIIQADTYLVFTGTLQAYTPYGIESLWIILKLLEKNPGKVFLLKTTDTLSNEWQNGAMVDAFYTRFKRPRMLIKQLLDAFITTLPEAVYLVGNDDHIVKIAAGIEVSDTSWREFFQEKVSGIFHRKYIVDSDGLIPLKDVFNIYPSISQDKRVPPLQHSNKEGVDMWNLISCSVEPFKTYARIHQDSFVEIDTEKYFTHWKLMLYGQSIHNRDGFTLMRSYDLLSGALGYSSNVKERVKVLEQQVAAAQQEVDQARDECKVENP